MAGRSGRKKSRAKSQLAAKRKQQGAKPQQLQVAVQQVLEQYSGPIPPPAMLAEYENVVPGAAKLVLDAWQRQSHHRQEMERTVVEGNVAAQRRGAFFGLIVALGVLLLAGYLAKIGSPTAAAIISATDIATLAGVFVYGKSDQRRERGERYKLMYGP